MAWKIQEIEVLIQFVKIFGESRWEDIANQINSKIKGSYKTGKQCRQKYINYIQIDKKGQRNNQWTIEQEKVLIELYKKCGPSWSSFTDQLSNKSQRSIKNKFYNNLRRFSRKLRDYQKEFFKNCRNHIEYENLVILLEIFAQIQKWNGLNGHIFDQNSKIWEIREKILKLTFDNFSLQNETQLYKLVINIKEINKHLRCFGIYKSNNKKLWKLTQKRAKLILNFESIMSEDDTSKIINQTNEIKIQEQFNQVVFSPVENHFHQELKSFLLDQRFCLVLYQQPKEKENKQNYFSQLLKQSYPNQQFDTDLM